MARALGSWITAQGLEKFDCAVLCDALRTEAEIFREKGIDIPPTPDEANINYAALETFFHTGGEAEPLADALFFASKLNSEEGWNCVKEEMLTACFQYTETGNLKISHGDHALKAWLRFKSKNASLLERSLGRLQNISVFSFTLFPVNETIPDHDLVTTFDESSLAEVQNRIADYYHLQTGERFAKVIQHGGFDDEIYFMIRYPGRLEFRNVLDGDKEIKDKKNPIWFHTVVYDKRNRMLKTSATTQELAELLRIQFGHLLFRQPNVFQSNKDALSKVITLDPITDDTDAFFDTAKDTHIRKVRLSRISCTLKDMGKIKGTFTCDEKDCRETVADFSPEGFTYSQNALTGKALTPAQKLLNSVHQIHWIQLKYEMKAPGDLRRGRDCKVTIKKGNQLGFEHDAGTRPILDYLYEKKLLNDTPLQLPAKVRSDIVHCLNGFALGELYSRSDWRRSLQTLFTQTEIHLKEAPGRYSSEWTDHNDMIHEVRRWDDGLFRGFPVDLRTASDKPEIIPEKELALCSLSVEGAYGLAQAVGHEPILQRCREIMGIAEKQVEAYRLTHPDGTVFVIESDFFKLTTYRNKKLQVGESYPLPALARAFLSVFIDSKGKKMTDEELDGLVVQKLKSRDEYDKAPKIRELNSAFRRTVTGKGTRLDGQTSRKESMKIYALIQKSQQWGRTLYWIDKDAVEIDYK